MNLQTHVSSPSEQLKLQAFLKNINYRVARTTNELEKVYDLVYKEYLNKNYINENESKLKFSLYNALPDTTTFIAIAGNEIIATATVIVDSELGLPMDKIYSQELDKFRKNKRKLCEISMLASNTELFSNGISLMLNTKKLFFVFSLFKLIFDYVREIIKLDLICITINPKHKLTYDFLLFKDFGGLKTYLDANGAPAIAKCLDLNSVEEECERTHKKGLYKMFLAQKTEPDKFSKKIIFSPEDLKYFFSEKSNTFRTANSQQLEYIKKCYPAYDFSEILK